MRLLFFEEPCPLPVFSPRPLCEPLFLIFGTNTWVSRRCEKKKRLRRDAQVALSRGNYQDPAIRSSFLKHANLKVGVPKNLFSACLLFSFVFSVPSVRALFWFLKDMPN